MSSNRRLVTIVGLLAISIYTAHVRRTRAHVVLPTKDYLVACLPKNADLTTADQKLKPFYDITHTPAEGGRCYIKFLSDDVMCVLPRVAARKGWKSFPSYLSHSGKSCYSSSIDQVKLIDALQEQPAIKRSTYNGTLVKTWEQVRDKLAP